MERLNPGTSSDYKYKVSGKNSESDSGVPLGASNQWHEKAAGDDKQCLGKRKRDRSSDREWSHDGSLQPRSKIIKEENSNDGEQQSNISQQQFPHIQQQSNVSQQFQPAQQLPPQQQMQPLSQQPPMQPLAPSYPAYGYGMPDQFNVDANQRSYPMISPYNMYAAMNHQWSGNQVDGMGMPLNAMQGNSALPVSTGIEMTPSTSAGINPYTAYMPMAGDMYGMMSGMGNYCPYPMFPQESMMAPIKEPISLSTCILYPPDPGQYIKTRERHPGCKTVFVGGLPEKITEEIIREIFDRCGEISTVRMSKKNFCHVRFASESYVAEAMKLSRYRIKIENKDESAYTGRFHVDYAKARDDEYEYECMQRALQRKARHRERLEQEACHRERLEQEASRPPTPPPVVHYSEHEGSLLGDKLRSEEHSKAVAAIHVLVTWLERGECNRKTCGNFYTMIMCNNTSARRLLAEKANLNKELDSAKKQMQKNMTLISLCFNDIYKVFETVQGSPSIIDNFSRSQKREIETMREKTLDIVRTHSKELVAERVKDEMDLSDGEENVEKPSNNLSESKKGIKEDLQKLKEDMERIRKELDDAYDENKSIKKERDSSSEAYSKVFQEIQGKVLAKQKETDELREFKENYLAAQSQKPDVSRSFESSPNQTQLSGNTLSITQHETRLIALIATFLNVHPFGASIDYICSYLIKIDSKINRRDAENLLQRFPVLFKEHTSGIGATLVKNFKFVGFNSNSE